MSAIKRFKQRTGFWLAQNHSPLRWQKDYYDHIIRNANDLTNQIRYILNNPVEAGLVKHWKEYPYRGSMVWDLDALDELWLCGDFC